MNSTHERLDTLRRHVYRNTDDRVYGVLDGASNPRLLSLLNEHDVDHVCLFRGELEPEVAMTAPYLVHLPPKSSFTDLVLLQQGWGQHWGILAISQADMRTLRQHFRKLTMVSEPAGKPLYFRYYDPRVLRNYLPTCTSHALRTMFGPVSAFLAEGIEPDTLLRFASDGAALACETLAVGPRAKHARRG